MFELNTLIREPKVFSLQVSGIKCTNCAGKIQKGLSEGLTERDAKISVNIMQQKINLTIFQEQSLMQAAQILKTMNFPLLNEPVLLSGGDQSHRSIAFKITDSQRSRQLADSFSAMLGIVKSIMTQKEGEIIIRITYNCDIIKGREIADLISDVDSTYKVINDRIDSFSRKPKVNDSINVTLTILLSLFFLIWSMVLPFTGDWYMIASTFPNSFGIFSFSLLINIAVTIYVMDRYAKGFVRRAYTNYVQFKSMNMETLIALGSVSAFFLFLFFLVRYSYESFQGELANTCEAIMYMTDALTSASIIVLVVTVGKYFESKVKQKIDRMTEQIFPESTLFMDMNVDYVQIKNRQLKINSVQQYDVSLLEKNDVYKIKHGRVLLDSIIVSGEVQAIQSANTGCDDVITLRKGERLESGSKVEDVHNDALAIVENVLENSILIQIGTQIKLTQNQEENNVTGIQAVCKRISNIFVKAVLCLSLLTMIVWSLLLITVQVPMCNVCWVVERGIGVLVASCPCALGLAVPSVIAIVLNLATKSGILIKNNSVFEKMKKCSKMAFDKTGTLFNRIARIEEYVILKSQYTQLQIWQIVALIEKEIRHPLAQILYKQAFQRSDVVGTNYSFLLLQKPTIRKEGLEAELLDKITNTKIAVLIGNKFILQANNIPNPIFERKTQSSTELYVVANGRPLMVIMINTHSNLRQQAKEVLMKLQQERMEVHILSGDSEQSVAKLGEYLELPDSCLHPEHSAFMKMKWIKEGQKDNRLVIMIGDGLNDIPCLQEAGIGISINAKSQLNINAADVVILSQNLYKILALVRFVKRGNLFIKINLFWAFAYNIVMMPIVAGMFYKFDLYVSPIWSSIAMSVSSLLVVGFSHFLSCFSYDDSLCKEKPQNSPELCTISTTESRNIRPQSRNTKKYQQLHEQLGNQNNRSPVKNKQ